MSLGFIVGTGAGKNTPAFSYRIPMALLTELNPTAGAICYDSYSRLKRLLEEKLATRLDVDIAVAAIRLLTEMDADIRKVRDSRRRYPLPPEQWPVCINPRDLEAFDPRTVHDIPKERLALTERITRIDRKVHEELHAFSRYKDAQLVEKIRLETGISIDMNDAGNRRHVDRISLDMLARVAFDIIRDFKSTNSRYIAAAKSLPKTEWGLKQYIYRFAGRKTKTWGAWTTIAEEIVARIEGFRYAEAELYREGRGSPFERNDLRDYLLDYFAAIYGGRFFELVYVGLKQRGITPRDFLDQAYEHAAPLIRRDAQRACVTKNRRRISVGETIRLDAPGIARTDAVVRQLFLSWNQHAKGANPRYGKAACTANVIPVGSGYDFEVDTRFTEKP